MRQLLLDISGDRPQNFSTFVTGQNQELLSLLQEIAAGTTVDLDRRFVYLWGESGSGKTHLLRALAEQCGGLVLGPDTPVEEFLPSAAEVTAIDDCDRLTPAQQIAAFALFNQVREQGGVLVTAGSAAPAALRLREDLRTRLGWGLVYHVQGLTDAEKLDALERAAQARGFQLSPGVLPWLITHFRRDMASLSAVLESLDRYSLETQRPVTLPLLKQLLELGEVNTNG